MEPTRYSYLRDHESSLQHSYSSQLLAIQQGMFHLNVS